MATRGMRELKRSKRAVPSPIRIHLPWGCLPWVIIYLLAFPFLYLFSSKGGWRWFVLVVPTAAIIAYGAMWLAYGLVLLGMVQRRWGKQGIRCLIVHSDSPVWAEHIQSHWLPRYGGTARQLNWSERATWPKSLEVRLFRRFCQAQYNFNPAVLVFRGYRAPLVFRFFYAFHEAKNGRPHYLEQLEDELEYALGVERGIPTRQ